MFVRRRVHRAPSIFVCVNSQNPTEAPDHTAPEDGLRRRGIFCICKPYNMALVFLNEYTFQIVLVYDK